MIIAGGVIFLLALSVVLFSVSNVEGFAGLGLFSPWSIAGGLSARLAIDVFSGEVAEENSYLAYHILVLCSILIYYILGPGLLIACGITTSSNEAENNTTPSPLFKTGLVLTIAGILTLGIEAFLVPKIQKNSRQSAASSAQKDQMRQHMIEMGINAYEYFILPDSLGGNKGSFAGLNDKTIMDGLDIQPEPYHLETVSDTLLKIVGRKPSPDNAAGKDSTHLILHVHPETILDWEKSN